MNYYSDYSEYIDKNNVLKELFDNNITNKRLEEISEELFELYDNANNIVIKDIPEELRERFNEFIEGHAYYVVDNISNYFYVDYKDWYANLPL
jgi:hypothetical protein